MHRSLITAAIMFSISPSLFTAPHISQDDWNCFLGGVGKETDAVIPLTWTPESNIAWKADIIGHGQSSPVIWEDSVYVTSVDGKMKDTYYLLAYSLKNGKELWRQSITNSDPVESSYYVSRAAPTPVVDSEGVYAFFESGDMIALDHQGEELWQRCLKDDFGAFKGRFGLGASPCQNESLLFILADHEGPSYLLGIDKSDGSDAWKTDRESRVSWSSPTMARIDDSEQIIISSTGTVDGYDATSGELLWTLEGLGGNTVGTPVLFDGNKVLIGAAPGQRGEGADVAGKSNLLLEIIADEEGYRPHVAWRAERVTSSFGSPILHRGFAYWINRSGIVFCVDTITGETKYSERLEQAPWATPFGIGDRIYCFGKDGQTTVLAAGPEFEVLATNELFTSADSAVSEAEGEANQGTQNFGGPIQYGYALTNDGLLLVRRGEALYAIRESQ